MSVPIVIAVWTISLSITLINSLIKKKDKYILDDEAYMVSSSRMILIFWSGLNILCSGFTIWFFSYIIETNQAKDLWYVDVLGLIFSFMSLWLYWERFSFRVRVSKKTFTVRNFFMKEKEYSFTDLTDYMESSLYGDGIVSVIDAYINNKCVISSNEWDIGYDKLRKDIKKHIKKNVQNVKKDIMLTAHLPLPILFIILGFVAIYGFFIVLSDFKEYGYVYGAENYPFKGIEFIILLLFIILAFIFYGLKHLTSKIYIHENSIIYKKYFFIKKYYSFKDFSYIVKKDEGGNHVIKIYDKNHSKIITIPSFYKNKDILIARLRSHGIKIKDI